MEESLYGLPPSPNGQQPYYPPTAPAADPYGQNYGQPGGMPSPVPNADPYGQNYGQPGGMPSPVPNADPYGQLGGMPSPVPNADPYGQNYAQPGGMPSPNPYNVAYQEMNNIQKSSKIDIEYYSLYQSLPMDPAMRKRRESKPNPRGKFVCRDVPFLVLFVVFWIGMLVISIQTFLVAPYDTLFYGRNSYDELCGTDNFTEYKYIAYFLSSKQMVNAENPIKYKVCANFCPEDYLLYNADLYKVENNETVYHLDKLDIQNSTYSENKLITVNFQNKSIYQIYEMVSAANEYDNILIPSMNIFNRCIPDLEIFGLGTWSDQLQGGVDFAARVYQSVLKSIPIILLEAAISFGLTFLWLLFTYFLTGIFIWFTVILSIVLLGAATLFSWYIYSQSNADAIRSSILDTNNPYVNKYLYNKNFFLVLSIILSVAFFITVLFFIFARKRINFGIRIIKEAGRAVMKYPLLSIIPLVQLVLIIGLTIFFALIFIPVTVTARENITVNTRKVIATHTPLKEDDISIKSYSLIIELYVVLGYYWTYYFIKAVGKTTICGTIATWYWAPRNDIGKRKYQSNAIVKTFCRICWYNLGSLALGSLILGLIALVKYILAKIQKMAEKQGQSSFVKWLIRALQCCIACFDKIIKFISKNAYVEIAIYGYSFCTASYKATKLIIRNAFRVLVVNKIANLIFVLGKILVVTITVYVTFNYIRKKDINDPYLLSIPLIISFLLSLTIISIFMTVLSSAIDTIFISVCEDLERNDGSTERPYYMRKRLRKLLVKDNKTEKETVENMY